MAEILESTSVGGTPPGLGRMDFQSRLSVRAIVGGAISTLAFMVLFMLLGAGFGIWDFRLGELPTLGMGFWIWSFACWVVCHFLGALVATLSARSVTARDGLLQGVATWAVACVGAYFILVYGSGHTFLFASDTNPKGMIWVAFIGDGLALIGALVAGAVGARSEAKMSEVETGYRGERVTHIGRAAG